MFNAVETPEAAHISCVFESMRAFDIAARSNHSLISMYKLRTLIEVGSQSVSLRIDRFSCLTTFIRGIYSTRFGKRSAAAVPTYKTDGEAVPRCVQVHYSFQEVTEPDSMMLSSFEVNKYGMASP